MISRHSALGVRLGVVEWQRESVVIPSCPHAYCLSIALFLCGFLLLYAVLRIKRRQAQSLSHAAHPSC